ncbi:SDR family oxidoreductase [Actinomadura terrae]|uniref:SDR family oxidoreductase n=1 Tax=Actinomadura terrae TaxID=604353 RepID=UPI001FA718EC|nr:SDR family oxidoreductase [Actinomadura terrae]
MTAARTVLVTGAAGLIGSEVVARLAAGGDRVVALTHSRTDIVRNNGRKVRTAEWRGRPEPGVITRLAGDVTAPGLGLGRDELRLLKSLDLVVHSAATTDFGRSAAVYETLNVGGTRNVLDLVRDVASAPVPLVHVSTAYVCGERTGTVLESDLDAGQTFGTLYEESKFRAETMVREAMAAGQPAAVVRPSIVVGDERSGTIRDFKNIYVVLKLFTEGRVRSVPGHYDAVLDLVPVDHVAEVITRAATRFEEAAGRTFHAVGAGAHTLGDFSEVMAEYPSFHVPRYIPPATFSADRMPAAERVYYDRVVGLYESFFCRRMVFHDAEAYDLLGRRPASKGQAQLRRLLNYCLRVGYLGARLPGIDEVLAALPAQKNAAEKETAP